MTINQRASFGPSTIADKNRNSLQYSVVTIEILTTTMSFAFTKTYVVNNFDRIA